MPSADPRVSVLIPTRNAGASFADVLRAMRGQTVPPCEILIMDTQSGDGTPDLARGYGATVMSVSPSEFDHGASRNVLARAATGDILAFLTQDAIPADDRWLERLVAPLVADRAVASFARQLPRPDATPVEAFARTFNYPPTSRIVTEGDVDRLGIRAYFFSNASSAVDRKTFERLGGFPEGHVMNEDLLFAARVLASGGAIAYVAESTVVHSHNYGPAATFRRYFDIGSVLSTSNVAPVAAPAVPAGLSYVAALLGHLLRSGALQWIPRALAESAAKAAGHALGRNVKHVPRTWRRHLSLHPDHWRSERSR